LLLLVVVEVVEVAVVEVRVGIEQITHHPPQRLHLKFQAAGVLLNPHFMLCLEQLIRLP